MIPGKIPAPDQLRQSVAFTRTKPVCLSQVLIAVEPYVRDVEPLGRVAQQFDHPLDVIEVIMRHHQSLQSKPAVDA
ncbi:hypothetical protein D3C72_2369800 [compost metagenome]